MHDSRREINGKIRNEENEMEMEKAGPCMHDVTAWNLATQDPTWMVLYPYV